MSPRRLGRALVLMLTLVLTGGSVCAGVYVRSFMTEQARVQVLTLREGPFGRGIWGVWTGHSFAYGIESGPKSVALVGSGSDPQAKAILAQLSARGMAPGDVGLILLPCGHDALTAGLGQFINATIWVGSQDRMLARRDVLPRAPLAWLEAKMMRTRRLPKMPMQAMWPGQDIAIGNMQAHLVALPGHTWGSFAIVAADIAFVGDGLKQTSEGVDILGRSLSVSPEHNIWALHRLSQTRFSSVALSRGGVMAFSQSMLAQWLGPKPAWAALGAAQR